MLKIIKILSVICVLSFLPLIAAAQTTLKGVVKDQDGNLLAGATVILKGTSQAAITNDKGYYSLTIGQDTGVLVFTYMGLRSLEVNIGGRAEINAVLETLANTLSEVVVIGYGTQSRHTTTTAVSKLDEKVLKNVPYSNAAAALQGTVSGVRVQSTTGQPGAAPRVIVRGGTSINSPDGAAPLYIIDGIQRTDMNNINPSDIESIQVLKDAASTAIYGARGSNGVVIVTTKSGKSGRVNISYRYDITRSEVSKRMDYLSAKDYLYFQRKGIVDGATIAGHPRSLLVGANSAGTGNDLTNNTLFTTQYLTADNQHKLNEGWQSMVDPIDPTRTLIFKETDWQDVVFKTGISHNHVLSASGGSEKALFNVGLGYLSNEGTAMDSDYKRLSVNMNGSLKINNKLSVSGRVLYSNTGNTNVIGNPFYRTMGAAPTMKYAFEDGTLAPGSGTTMFNPAYQLDYVDARNEVDDLTIAVGGRWEIVPGLTFEPQLSLYQRTSYGRYFAKAAYRTGLTSIDDSRSASGSYSKHLQYQADGVFSYNKTFGERHNLGASAGFSYYTAESRGLNATGRYAASDLIPTLNASSEPFAVGGSESHTAIAGFFGRVNYDYDQRYLLSVSARYDGASSLGENHKWGFFPGVSAGWNVHRENFWTLPPKILSTLKPRVSYGVNGNISGLGAYQAQGEYTVGEVYGGNAAIVNSTMANQELQWEQSKTFDVGVDIGFLDDRISLLFDYYRRVTDNLLTSMSLPYSTGFSSILTNLGSLENRGFEVELSARILPASSALQWNVSFNAANVKNKILELPYNGVENNRIGGVHVWDPSKGDYGWLGGLQEGGRMGDMFAYKHLGVYATDADAATAPLDMIMPLGGKTKYGGDVIWQDTDDNGLIEEVDRVYVGNPYPSWTGGFSTTLNYKNIDLYIRMDYMLGHTIYNYLLAEHVGQTHGDAAISSLVKQSWQEQGDVTDIPRYLWFDRRYSQLRGSSYFYEKGDYLALREITLSYRLPERWTNAIKMSNISVNVTGNNLYYFTKYRGLSPEYGGQDQGRYPVPRVFMLGINLTF